jgi:hypothetical protein
MRRVVQGLKAWCESWCCLMRFICGESAMSTRILLTSAFVGLVITAFVSFKVSNYYVVFITFGILIIIFIIAFFTVFITGFKSLTDILPMLVKELDGKASFERVEAPQYLTQCLTKHFSGRAIEVLGRLYSRSLIITLIAMYPLIIMSSGLALLLITGPSLSLNELMHAISLFIKEVSTVLGTSVDVALGILGVVITVIFSLGSLLIGRDVINAEFLRVVHGVRFHSLTWFSIAITLIIVSIMLPPIVSIVLIAPITLAITISLMIYLTLATTVIEYMQLLRGNQGGDQEG